MGSGARLSCVTSAHLKAPGNQQRLRQGLPLGPNNRRKGHCSLCRISIPFTATRCGFRPATCLLCAQFAICRRQVIQAVISLSTGISSLEKVPISVSGSSETMTFWDSHTSAFADQFHSELPAELSFAAAQPLSRLSDSSAVSEPGGTFFLLFRCWAFQHRRLSLPFFSCLRLDPLLSLNSPHCWRTESRALNCRVPVR